MVYSALGRIRFGRHRSPPRAIVTDRWYRQLFERCQRTLVVALNDTSPQNQQLGYYNETVLRITIISQLYRATKCFAACATTTFIPLAWAPIPRGSPLCQESVLV